MDTAASAAIGGATDIPAIGAPFGGGFFAGIIPGTRCALIVAPKDGGEAESIRWQTDYTSTLGARSLSDGAANTEAMNDDAHPAAQFCRKLTIGGFDDWYLPSRTELNLLCEAFTPTSGGNPEQTTAAAFQDEGPEAFAEEWHWSSTEFSSDYAWFQLFGAGDQTGGDKNDRFRCRAVRKVLI
jgi:hypothetical protein